MNNLETNECSIWDPKTSQPTSPCINGGTCRDLVNAYSCM